MNIILKHARALFIFSLSVLIPVSCKNPQPPMEPMSSSVSSGATFEDLLTQLNGNTFHVTWSGGDVDIKMKEDSTRKVVGLNIRGLNKDKKDSIINRKSFEDIALAGLVESSTDDTLTFVREAHFTTAGNSPESEKIKIIVKMVPPTKKSPSVLQLSILDNGTGKPYYFYKNDSLPESRPLKDITLTLKPQPNPQPKPQTKP